MINFISTRLIGSTGGGTFFIGGDDLQEVNFNVYTVGADVTYYLNNNAAVEGEFTSSFGLAQDVFFNNAKVEHIQVPDVWSFSGNVLFFPGGAPGKRVPFYITGGLGAVSLEPRTQTRRFGYDMEKLGWQTFIAENIGGGLKIFRTASAANWGFRADYRYLIVNSSDSVPAFFAKTKARGAHRVYFGLLYTWKR